jgi:hypothetical protein
MMPSWIALLRPRILKAAAARWRAEAMSPDAAGSTDLTLVGSGSVYLLRPVSAAGSVWIAMHIPFDAKWLGGAVVVEHRDVGAIVRGAIADGLRVR